MSRPHSSSPDPHSSSQDFSNYDNSSVTSSNPALSSLNPESSSPPMSNEHIELLASPSDYEHLGLDLDSEPASHAATESASNSPPNAFLTLSQTQSVLEGSDEDKDSFKFRFTQVMQPCSNSIPGRAKSAPPRPLTDAEIFRASKEFLCLESAALAIGNLLNKPDGKLDLDSVEGNNNCKNLLNKTEDLVIAFLIKPADRSYRDTFSQPYKALYKEGSLCYLTEILDSAQEGLPYILVNSEKYIFSANVLHTGKKLFESFAKLKTSLRDVYEMYYFLELIGLM